MARNVRALNPEGCLYCRRHDGAFAGREHPMSEGLGNKRYVLGRGVTCDRCNNGPLSAVDRALLAFPSIAFLRTTLGVPGKRGKRPISRFANATITATGNEEFVLEAADRSAVQVVAPGHVRLSLEPSAPISSQRAAMVARAIWKATLGLVYLDPKRGPEVAFHAKFDPVRELIVGTREAHGWLGASATGPPIDESALIDIPGVNNDGEELLAVLFDFFGVRLMTELLVRRPTISGDAAHHLFVF